MAFYFDTELHRERGPVPVRVGFTVERSRETNYQVEISIDSVDPDIVTTPEETEDLRSEAYAHHLRQ